MNPDPQRQDPLPAALSKAEVNIVTGAGREALYIGEKLAATAEGSNGRFSTKEVLAALGVNADCVEADSSCLDGGSFPVSFNEIITPQQAAEQAQAKFEQKYAVATEIRRNLDRQLAQAEELLGVSTDKFRIMPYVIVVGAGEEQRIFATGNDTKIYSRVRTIVDYEQFLDLQGFAYSLKAPGTSKDQVRRYAANLMEFGLGGCGVLVEGKLQGAVFPHRHAWNGDPQLSVIGTSYAEDPQDRAILCMEEDTRYDERGALNDSARDIVTDAGEAKDPGCRLLVVLGSDSDIPGILTGKYEFNGENWIPKHISG